MKTLLDLTNHLLNCGGTQIDCPAEFDAAYVRSPLKYLRDVNRSLVPQPGTKALVNLNPDIRNPEEDGMLVFVYSQSSFECMKKHAHDMTTMYANVVPPNARPTWYEFRLGTAEEIAQFLEAIGAVRIGVAWTN